MGETQYLRMNTCEVIAEPNQHHGQGMRSAMELISSLLHILEMELTHQVWMAMAVPVESTRSSLGKGNIFRYQDLESKIETCIILYAYNRLDT